jgi:hypothetical protein
MPNNFSVRIEGMDELQAAFKRFPVEVKKNMQQAGAEAAKTVLLPTVGLQKYPPATSANMPPTPYYLRGRGTQNKSGNVGNSERLGTQWYTRPIGAMGTEIGNRASYAQYVHGEEQAQAMGAIGWRQLVEVAKEKGAAIQAVFDKWIKYTLRKVGLV